MVISSSAALITEELHVELTAKWFPPVPPCSPLRGVSHSPGKRQPEQRDSAVARARPAQRSHPGVRHQILWEGTRLYMCTTLKLHLRPQAQNTVVICFGLCQHILFILQKKKQTNKKKTLPYTYSSSLWEQQNVSVTAIPGEHKLIVFKGLRLSWAKILWMQRSAAG